MIKLTGTHKEESITSGAMFGAGRDNTASSINMAAFNQGGCSEAKHCSAMSFLNLIFFLNVVVFILYNPKLFCIISAIIEALSIAATCLYRIVNA